MFKKLIRKYVKEAYMLGYRQGLVDGRRLGEAEINGQAIITGKPLIDKQIKEIIDNGG